MNSRKKKIIAQTKKKKKATNHEHFIQQIHVSVQNQLPTSFPFP